MILNFNESDSQNLIYSLILLAFLLSSLFFRREFKLSQTLKYLAIWFALILSGVLLYSFRFEFQSVKNRLMGELNPSSAQITKSGKITINISKDGHFYLKSKINNKPVLFMIDTGASDIVLNLKDAKNAGINFSELIFNKRYQTANGAIYGASTTLNKIEISGVKFYNIKASVNQADLGVSLLGMSFLRKFKKYEFYQDKLVLEP